MTDEYRVPKRTIEADVTVAGQKRAGLTLFLSGQAAAHAGFERPSDLLNGPDPFFPATDKKGRGVLLHRDSVLVLSVPSVDEIVAPDGSDGGDSEGALATSMTSVIVDVALENGDSLKGVVEFAMPEGRRRLVDFLNLEERFLPLRDGGTVHLINKSRIARISLRDNVRSLLTHRRRHGAHR